MSLSRFEANPVISPSKNWWENKATFNPAASIVGDKVNVLYRAIGSDGLSRFGLATSLDGVSFTRFADPIFEGDIDNPLERLGVEDPRISKIGDTYYVTYTAASVYSADTFRTGNFAPSLSALAPWRVRASLVTTKDFQNFERCGVLLPSDSKDACFLPEKLHDFFILYHRIYPNAYLTYSKYLKTWAPNYLVFGPRPGFWDEERVGMGATPIKTEKGWLSFYHGVDRDHNYHVGIMVFDKSDPAKIIYRSPKPLFSPQEDYEKIGRINNVVFTCGVVEKDGRFFIYYGAADKVIGLATINKEELLQSITL